MSQMISGKTRQRFISHEDKKWVCSGIKLKCFYFESKKYQPGFDYMDLCFPSKAQYP